MTYSPSWTVNGLALTEAPYGVIQDAADPGSPDFVSVTLASMIVDGDIELTQRAGNRTYQLPVVIEGTDRATIATAQADLVRAVEQAFGTLEFDPGDGSDVTVFETFAGTVSLPNGGDDAGAQNGMQRLTVSIPCRPSVRPTTEVVIQATPGTATVSLVDACSSATGWTAIGGSSVSLSSGHLLVSALFLAAGTQTVGMIRPGTADTGGLPFVYVDWKPTSAGKRVTARRLVVAGQSLGLVSEYPSPLDPTRTRSVFAAWSGTTGPLRFEVDFSGSPSSAQVDLYRIEATSSALGTTAKVMTQHVPIYGSHRTEVSITVAGFDAAGTSAVALGEQTLVHTASAGTDGRAKFIACRITTGTAGSADASAVSGSSNALNTSTTSSPVSFTFRAASLLPGEWIIGSRLKASSASTQSIFFSASLDGASALDVVGVAQAVALPLTTSYGIRLLGSLMLPPAEVEDAGAVVTVQVGANPNAATATLDEVFLMHVETGQVTLLDTSGGFNAVRLDAAKVDTRTPAVWYGYAATDGTSALMAAGSRIQAMEQHLGEAGLMQVTTVTPTCPTPQVTVRYFPHDAHDVAPIPVGVA